MVLARQSVINTFQLVKGRALPERLHKLLLECLLFEDIRAVSHLCKVLALRSADMAACG